MTEKISKFAESLLSKKLFGLVAAFIAANIWLPLGKISGDNYVALTAIILAGLLGASYIDNKKEVASGAPIQEK